VCVCTYTHTHTNIIFLSSADIEGCQRKRTPLQEFGAFEKSQILLQRHWVLEVNLKPLLGSVETNDSTSFGGIQGSMVSLLLEDDEGTENERDDGLRREGDKAMKGIRERENRS
jgi:hypothetical protein